jgi:hypothetical protein
MDQRSLNFPDYMSVRGTIPVEHIHEMTVGGQVYSPDQIGHKKKTSAENT